MAEKPPRGGKPPASRKPPGPRKASSGGGKPPAGRPGTGRPGMGKPPAGRSAAGKPADRERPDTRRPDRRDADRPRDPVLPDAVTADQLDKGVGLELRTLPEGLADIVARHLVAADLALVEEDIPLARAHVAAAKRRAGRVAAVREAAGITAYLAGEYAEAIAELRTVRRMTGTDDYVPMMADCERGLGRPQRALDLLREVDVRSASPDLRVELLLVTAGARADLGQLEAAILVLQVPELRKLPPGAPRARLQYAYADLLERAGRFAEAREWMEKAAESDVDGVTDAAERVDEEAGLSFIEDEDDVAVDGEGNHQP